MELVHVYNQSSIVNILNIYNNNKIYNIIKFYHKYFRIIDIIDYIRMPLSIFLV